jgi:hypothetical protein
MYTEFKYMKSHRTHSETEVFPTLSSHNEVMPGQFCQQFANTCCSTNKGGFLKLGDPQNNGFPWVSILKWSILIYFGWFGGTLILGYFRKPPNKLVQRQLCVYDGITLPPLDALLHLWVWTIRERRLAWISVPGPPFGLIFNQTPKTIMKSCLHGHFKRGHDLRNFQTHWMGPSGFASVREQCWLVTGTDGDIPNRTRLVRYGVAYSGKKHVRKEHG